MSTPFFLHPEDKEPLDGGAAASVISEARMAITAAHHLREDVERLLIITEALWGILREEIGCTDDELVERMEEIDLRDGRLDGRVAPGPAEPCSRCGRKVSRFRRYCLFCGTLLTRGPFER